MLAKDLTGSPLKDAIKRLPIPLLWQRLGLPGRVTNQCVVCSPLRDDDRHPSFSIYADGRRWRDHATGQGGDSFDLFKLIKGLDTKAALSAFVRLSRI